MSAETTEDRLRYVCALLGRLGQILWRGYKDRL